MLAVRAPWSTKLALAALVTLAATLRIALVDSIEPAVPALDPAPTFHLIPLAGDPLRTAVEDSGYQHCVPFLAQIVARPNWRLRIAEHASSCTERHLVGSFAVESTGAVIWTVPGLPDRPLALTPDELVQVRRLGAVDCVRIGDVGYGGYSYKIAVGDDVEATDGAYIPGPSNLGHALDAIFDAAIARYDRARLAELGSIRLVAWNDHERLELDDHLLHVQHRERDELLEDRELVDLVDRLLAEPRDLDYPVSGILHTGDRSLKFAVRPFGREWDPARALMRRLD